MSNLTYAEAKRLCKEAGWKYKEWVDYGGAFLVQVVRESPDDPTLYDRLTLTGSPSTPADKSAVRARIVALVKAEA